MSSEFLKCTICPKLPTFSDSSHLLTHVGSKGHLAHLHKLQVKSHQELEAANKITIYNQWYTEHNVAQLLSERMLQKEAKQAGKKIAEELRASNIKSQTKRNKQKAIKPQQSPRPPPRHLEPFLPPLRSSVINLDDSTFTPVRLPRGAKYPMPPSSLPELLLSPADEDDEDNYPAISEEFEIRNPSSSPRLKGIKWPGMGLFDAATLELQRKRNQKKDSSVLRTLELLSTRVDPHETVHSAEGLVLKRRHMDNLENDSPVKGEFSVDEPTPKRQRSSRSRSVKPPKEPQVPKMTKVPKKVQAKRGPGRPRRNAGSPLADPTNLVTSDDEERNRKMTRFSPTEDEEREFKLAVRNVRRNTKNSFLVYEDSSPSFGHDGSSEMATSTYFDTDIVETRSAHEPGPSYQQRNGINNPLKEIRHRLATTSTVADLGQGKENANPFYASNHTFGNPHFINPLHFGSSPDRLNFNPLAQHVRPTAVITSRFDPFDDDDAFVPVRNPLVVGIDHMHRAGQQILFGFPNSPVAADKMRQPLFAP